VIFLTVGSMFPFDRLIRAVDEMVADGRITDRLTAQIGDGRYEPRHFAFDRFLDKPEYEVRIAEASLLIAHAGAGTIALAIQRGKPLLVVPRLKSHGEHVNDHQIATARKFEELGHVLVARETAEIPVKLAALKTFRPMPREVQTERLARRIGLLLAGVR